MRETMREGNERRKEKEMRGLRSLTERELGVRLGLHEYRQAKEAAERKLTWIIDRYGDEDGERRKPGYLAQLIAEAAKSQALTRLTLEMAELDRYATEIGIKKNSPLN